MKLIRVFPRRTDFTPTDDMAFVGDPPMIRPEADEVHVSCTFTWDVNRARYLAAAWNQYYPVVRIGGPAYYAPDDGFTPGMYVKSGVTFTSRGCPNSCPFCLVSHREGGLKLLEIKPGYIIQDNNFAACPSKHRKAVYWMLDRQSKAAEFRGGIEADLVTPDLVAEFRSIRIHSVFLACDFDSRKRALSYALDNLSFLGRNKLYCYVLIGFKGTGFFDMLHDARRLEYVWNAGAIPFAQLYQPADRLIKYPKEWRDLARQWSRPAIIKSKHKNLSVSGEEALKP